MTEPVKARDLTLLGGLGVACVVAGSGLVAAELAVGGYALAAAGSVLSGAGLAVATWKAHKSALRTAALIKDHRRGVARGRADVKELRELVTSLQGQLNSRPPAPASPPPSAVGRPTRTIRASSVPGLDQAAQGRHAAAAVPDPERPHKLFAATYGMGSLDARPIEQPRRGVAVIASTALVEQLERDYAVSRLHPGTELAELDHAEPTALVIEERALEAGVWFGALRATGAALFAELQAVLSWAQAQQVTVYVLPDSVARPFSGALRRQASQLVRSGATAPAVDPDVRLPLLEALVGYLDGAPGPAAPSLKGATAHAG